jgi:hypothetical protein
MMNVVAADSDQSDAFLLFLQAAIKGQHAQA